MSKVPQIPPPGWVETSLNQVALLRNEHVDPFTLQGKPYLSLEHIESGTNRIINRGYSEDVKSIKSIFYSGDVLYGKLRPYLNKVCQPDFDGISSTDILVFAPSPALDNTFLLKLLSRHETVEYANSHSKGINLPRVSPSQLGELKFCLPPLNEQQRIVTRIEDLQARSRRAREAIETIPDLLEQLRQSLLAAAFSGDLTKEWRKKNPDVEPASELLKRIRLERRKRWEKAELENLGSKGLMGERLDEEFFKRRKQYKEPVPADETGLSDLPDGWCWASAEELTQIITDGEHQTPPRSSSGIPLLSARNIQNGYLSLEEVDYVPEAVYETIKKRLEVEAGDVLMSCSGSLGRTSVIEERARFAMVRSVALLRPVLTEMGQFLSFGIMSPLLQAQIDSKKTQTAQANIFQGKIKTLVFPMPGMREQKRICEIVADALKRGSDQKETVIATLTSVNQLDQRILAKAFRGELVPQDPNDEPASVLTERIWKEKARKGAERKTRFERGMKMKLKENEQRKVLTVLQQAKRAMTPEEIFMACGFDEESVDIFYEQLRHAVVGNQIRETRDSDSITLEMVKP